MNEEFFKIVGIVIVVGYLIYLAVKSMTLQTSIIEGLTNSDSSSNDALNQNKASGAQNYANEINKIQSRITDGLLIKDNRNAYENVIIQMDDLINALMLQKILSISQSSLSEDTLLDVIDKINKMNEGKRSLNSIMKFIDGM
jgi:CRISPR/Cas system CSM-associated protein Csm2 small subunit